MSQKARVVKTVPAVTYIYVLDAIQMKHSARSYYFFFLLFLCSCNLGLISCNENSEKRKIETVQLYRFYKVLREPEKLVVDTTHLTAIEKARLKTYLDTNHIVYFINESGDLYLKKDPIQNDILLQFWVITDDAIFK